MKTLKDVYIKVTKQNQKELGKILYINKPEIGYNISFNSDSLDNVTYGSEYKQKISLAELKRLIETIPTRDEITRLKRQISAYKTNYDKVVKHSLSKEDIIEKLQSDNERLNNINLTLKQTNNVLYDSEDALIESRDKWIALGESLERKNTELREENERLKNKKWWQIWK